MKEDKLIRFDLLLRLLLVNRSLFRKEQKMGGGKDLTDVLVMPPDQHEKYLRLC